MAGKGYIKELKRQNKGLREQLNEAQKKIKELENSITEHEAPKQAEKKKIKVRNWNIVKSGKYYRAYRRIKGKVRSVYVGKKLNEAKGKIDAWEAKFLVRQS